jgi:hypothetical protein
MSWSPNDLLSDQDLVAYEGAILTQFGKSNWTAKRDKAIEDWLFPILRTHGFTPERFRTRVEASKVWGFTGAAYTDETSAARDTTTDDVNLATVFTTFGTDALYVGLSQVFRGLSIRMETAVNAVASAASVAHWSDEWSGLTISDATQKVGGKSFSGGGALSWTVPSTWVQRSINGSDRLYWVKVSVAAALTAGTKAGQIGCIRRSVFCAPVAFRTLTLIFREAPTGGPGPWAEKAAFYEQEADAALQRALQICGGEFETDDPQTDQLSETETEQATGEVNGGGWRMERS